MAVQEHPRRLSRTARRLWLAVLLVYGAAAVADIATHLAADQRAGRSWYVPENLAVAFAGGLFWPVDLVAKHLLSL